jgi:hypothetical protein
MLLRTRALSCERAALILGPRNPGSKVGQAGAERALRVTKLERAPRPTRRRLDGAGASGVAPGKGVSSKLPRKGCLVKTYRSPFVWARWVAALGALGAVATLADSAAALPLVGISASLRGLYGIGLGDSQRIQAGGAANQANASKDWNPYAGGLGLRAGVTLLSIYAGASFDYFFAETTHLEGIEISGGRVQVMGNLGYEIGLPLLTLRPLLGVGYAQTQIESNLGSDHEQQELVVAPGAELMVSLGVVNVSGEVRYNFTGTADAAIVGIGAGVSF